VARDVLVPGDMATQRDQGWTIVAFIILSTSMLVALVMVMAVLLMK
jgi:hypothetical protein